MNRNEINVNSIVHCNGQNCRWPGCWPQPWNLSLISPCMIYWPIDQNTSQTERSVTSQIVLSVRGHKANIISNVLSGWYRTSATTSNKAWNILIKVSGFGICDISTRCIDHRHIKCMIRLRYTKRRVDLDNAKWVTINETNQEKDYSVGKLKKGWNTTWKQR